jgi:RNA polymerase sigma-70 factor (ECF subfamily)
MQDSEHGRWVQGIVERYETALVRYAAQLTGNLDSARDVVQDTFLKLCAQNPAGLDGHLVEWLYTVCRNRALDLYRKEQHMRLVSVEPADIGERAAAEQVAAVEQAETSVRVLRCVERLTDNQREVVRLKFQHALSYKEIAAVTGLSVSNVGFLLHTALKRLREELGDGDRENA